MNRNLARLRPFRAFAPVAPSRQWQLRAFFWLVAVVLGALHAWAGAMRQSMNADGIAYLDMGDAYWRGDWNMAINSVWSPLYSWLLGLVIRLGVQHPTRSFP